MPSKVSLFAYTEEFKVTKHSKLSFTTISSSFRRLMKVLRYDSVAKLAETARRANITRQHNLKLQGFIVGDDVSD